MWEDGWGCANWISDWLEHVTAEVAKKLSGNSAVAESPVYPRVVDAQGRIAGFLEDGRIIEDIPESKVMVWADCKLIFFPGSGAAARIKFNGTASGTLNLKLALVQPDMTTAHQVIYLGVPVNSQTQGSIDATSEDYLMRLDSDGDGDIDQQIPPSEINILRRNAVYLPLILKNYTPGPPPPVTATPTRTPTPMQTATPTRTPICQEFICNGSFETVGCWTIPSTLRPAVYTTAVARSGSQSMHLGITDQSDALSDSSIYQTVTIPGNAMSATLSFWYYPICNDPPLDDWQEVIIYTQSWGFITRAMGKICSNSQTWTHHTFSLTPYKGQTIILYFNVYNDGVGNLKTAMYLDDVSVQVCY